MELRCTDRSQLSPNQQAAEFCAQINAFYLLAGTNAMPRTIAWAWQERHPGKGILAQIQQSSSQQIEFICLAETKQKCGWIGV